MDLIEAAIDWIDSLDPGEKFVYKEIADRFGVDRSTLSRRHRRVTRARAIANRNQRILNPE